jgi:hypothetical protein
VIRDIDEDALYDAAYDAFLRYWLALDTDAEDELWAAYCAAEQQLEQWLRERQRTEAPPAEARGARFDQIH